MIETPERKPNCAECPLRAHKCVAGDGPLEAEFLIVAEAPGKNEMEAGIPLVGWSGTVVNEAIAYYGVPRKSVRVENVFQSQTPYTSAAGKAAALCCGPSLWDVVAAMPNLRTVLAFGEAALRELSGYRAYAQDQAEHKVALKRYERETRARAKWMVKLSKWGVRKAQKEAEWRAKYEDFIANKAFRVLKSGKTVARKPPKEPKIPAQPVAPPMPVLPTEPTSFGIKGISNYRGSPLWVRGYEGRIRLMPVLHPAMAAPRRQPRMRPLILNDIRRAVEFHKGSRTEMIPVIQRIADADTLKAFIDTMPWGRIALDVEWSRKHNQLVSIGIGTDKVGVVAFFSEAWEMPLRERTKCISLLQQAFDDECFEWGGHFVAGYDEHALTRVGLFVRCVWDSLYSFHILHADLGSAKDEESEELQRGQRKLGNSSASGYSLGFVTSVMCDMPYHKDMLDRDAAELPLAQLIEYNGRDVAACWRAQVVMDAEGAREMPAGVFARELLEEMALTRAAQKMSRRGVPINEPERQKRLKHWTEIQESVAGRCRALVGDASFNIGSGHQLAVFLENQGIAVRRNKDTNNPMLAGNEIQKLARRYPNEEILRLALEYRKAEKEIVGYVAIEPGYDGYAHPSWKIHGTVSGRWSSTPNFQNLRKEQREVIG